MTKENTKNKELLDNSRELQKDAMMNIEKLTKDSTEAKETSKRKEDCVFDPEDRGNARGHEGCRARSRRSRRGVTFSET